MIRELATKLDFPSEDVAYLAECYEKMTASPTTRSALLHAADRFFLESHGTYEAELDVVARETGIHRYTVDLVFLLICARPLKYLYHVRGIPEEIYYASLADMRAKLWECKRVHGITGTFVTWWYPGFYTCKRFALGRLQYEHIAFSFDDYKGILKKGDTVYNCHIPSLGSLDREDVIDSLRRAHAFYRAELKDGILPVYCSSWLLHPPTAKCYPEGSNLRAFFELFNVLQWSDDEKNSNFWRVFDEVFTPEGLADAPERTTLQRSLKQMIQNGQSMGSGKAILLFDGEKLLEK